MATVRSESSGASCAWPVSIPRPELAGHHPPRSPRSRAEGRVPSPSPGHRLSLGRTASPLARFPKPKTDSRMEVEGISGPTQCGGRRVPDVTTGALAGRVEARPVPPAHAARMRPRLLCRGPLSDVFPRTTAFASPGRNRVLDPAAPGKRLLSLVPLMSPFASDSSFTFLPLGQSEPQKRTLFLPSSFVTSRRKTPPGTVSFHLGAHSRVSLASAPFSLPSEAVGAS